MLFQWEEKQAWITLIYLRDWTQWTQAVNFVKLIYLTDSESRGGKLLYLVLLLIDKQFYEWIFFILPICMHWGRAKFKNFWKFVFYIFQIWQERHALLIFACFISEIQTFIFNSNDLRCLLGVKPKYALRSL